MGQRVPQIPDETRRAPRPALCGPHKESSSRVGVSEELPFPLKRWTSGRPNIAMSNEWSDPNRVTDYLSREIPHRALAEAMLVEALPERIDRFLDLGTGGGRLISLVREAHPQARAVGLDLSEPMLARAGARFDGDGSVLGLLRPGGVFANLDLVKSASPELHERFRKQIGRLEDDPADRLADLSAQLDWLRDTGFENVECLQVARAGADGRDPPTR
jgi:tRNA (cmo5U34)-methyltransferase